MKYNGYFRKEKFAGFTLRLYLFLILAIILSSCAQEPQESDHPQIQEEETSLIPSTFSTSMSSSTSTISLIDTEKVPEQARMLVQALTKKNDSEQEWRIFPEGVMYHDIHIGDGKSIPNGVAVHMLLRGVLEDGTEFVNTTKRINKSYSFTFGQGDTLKSFEQGVASMREKGKRVIVIPPELGYGEHEYKSLYITIPPHSTLIYEASVMWIKEPEFEKINLFK